MNKLKLASTIITLSVLIYGIFEMKSFIDTNFVKNDTKLKNEVNNFLNGKVKETKKSEKDDQKDL